MHFLPHGKQSPVGIPDAGLSPESAACQTLMHSSTSAARLATCSACARLHCHEFLLALFCDRRDFFWEVLFGTQGPSRSFGVSQQDQWRLLSQLNCPVLLASRRTACFFCVGRSLDWSFLNQIVEPFELPWIFTIKCRRTKKELYR